VATVAGGLVVVTAVVVQAWGLSPRRIGRRDAGEPVVEAHV